MSKNTRLPTEKGPFRAEQLRSGDPYELSHGHPVLCLPTGGQGSRANLLGAQVLETDPAVESAGVDTGYSLAPDALRAPDIAVGNVPDRPGWVSGTPPLAVEYADSGQDEKDLLAKIQELLAAGTQFIWVVRLTGPRRVEIHQPGQAMRLAYPGEELLAPGILQNPVAVAALFDREAAHEGVLHNLLQRRGYDSLEAVRAEGIAEGEIQTLQKAIINVLEARDLSVDGRLQQVLQNCRDSTLLTTWLTKAATVKSAAELLTIASGGDSEPAQ